MVGRKGLRTEREVKGRGGNYVFSLNGNGGNYVSNSIFLGIENNFPL